MQFNVLGPLEVLDGFSVRTPTAPRLQQVLSLMVLSCNRVVTAATISRELMLTSAESNAVATVQTYMFELRRILDGGVGNGFRDSMLRTEQVGYRLLVDEDQIDVCRFDRLVAGADQLLTEDRHLRTRGCREQVPGLPAQAANLLRQAVELWRGRPFAGIRIGPLLEAEAVLLQARWERATELRMRADLLLGRHREIVAELRGLVAEYPMNERFHGQLMVALHRCGRRADALELYNRYRRRMAQEAAASPGVLLEGIRQAILADDVGTGSPA